MGCMIYASCSKYLSQNGQNVGSLFGDQDFGDQDLDSCNPKS